MSTFIPNPDATIKIKCPRCGYESDELFFELQSTRQFTCKGCSRIVSIQGDAFEDIEKAISNSIK